MVKHHDGPDLFDINVSRAKRDSGIQLVIGNNPDFAYLFHQFVLSLPLGWTGQCEDIRRIWPHTHPKPQAWGAVVNAAKKLGMLTALDVEVPMTASKSHARKTHLLKRT